MTAPGPMGAAVGAVVAGYPAPVASLFRAVRDRVYAVAEARETGPVDETLKWGEPAYLPVKRRVGTTIRLAWAPRLGMDLGLFVPCSTTLLDQYRTLFPDAFTYDGNRMVRLGPDAAASPALDAVLGMALAYHRDKRQSETGQYSS